jgi:rod shape determining protein RodA
MDLRVALLAAVVAFVGLVFVDSATIADPDSRAQLGKQVFVLCASALAGVVVVLIPYPRVMRSAGLLYGAAILALLLLPVFGVVINGAQRWYRLPGGFLLQPSEFAKLALIIVLARYLRFRSAAGIKEGLLVPTLMTAIPAALVLRQPDLGSSVVFWPVLLAMCYVAGTPLRGILALVGLGAVVMALGYFLLHDYQRQRIDVWHQHFAWEPEHRPQGEEEVASARAMRAMLRAQAYQPWQALIAIGSGGLWGFGLRHGPQNVNDFLPYRSSDYVFAVVAEETGLFGCVVVLGLQLALVLALLGVAQRSRERFGRLVAVGVAVYIGGQTLLHAAVCAWLIPATGLPMPLVSQGGSSTLAAVLAIALSLSVSARPEPVLAADGFT